MAEHLSLKDILDPSNLHYEFPVKNRESRFKELVVYVAHACVNDPTYNRTKLLKILFHSDFESFGMYREPITGVRYRKLPYGPCPADFPRIQEEMERDRLIHVHKQRVHDFTSHRLIPLEQPTFEYLKARDTFIVNRWVNFFWRKSAKWVSDYSHGMAWKIAGQGEPIPYEAVFISDEPVTFEDVELVKQLGAQHGWKL